MKKLIGTVALAAVAAGALWYLNRPTAGGPPKRPPALIDAAPVVAETVVERINAVGTLNSRESVVVRPEVAGRVVAIDFDEGSRVEKGQVLFRLDDSTTRADVQSAEAELKLSQINFTRAEELVARGTVSAQRFDEAKSDLKVKQSQLDLAKARLDKTVLKAPFDGVTGLRSVSVGAYVTPGQDLVNLEDISTLKVDFKLPEVYLGSLGVGQHVRLQVDAFATESFDGVVFAIEPRIDQEARSVLLRAEVKNPDLRLRPGMFARLELTVATRDNALLIPEEAVVPEGENVFAYRVTDGKVEKVRLVPGVRQGTRLEVKEGLSAGDMVVTAGHLKIEPGAAVTVRGADSPTPTEVK